MKEYKVVKVWEAEETLQAALDRVAAEGWEVVSTMYLYHTQGEYYTTERWALYTVVLSRDKK